MNLPNGQILSSCLFKEATDGEVIKKTEDLIHHDTLKVVLLALAEIGIAWIISNIVRRWCEKVASKSLNKGVMTFLGSFLSIAIKTVGVIIALDQLGVSMNVIIGTMSGLGVGVALALKNNMASVASGLQILLTKPFKVGDYISIGSNYGTVTSIELTFTTLLTNDNEQVVVPNNNFLSDNLVNYTGREMLRCVLDFPCNSTEIQYYLQRLADCAIACPLVLQDPIPVARVDHYQSGGLADLKLIYYCDTSRYWDTYDQVTQAVSALFKQEFPATAPDKAQEPVLPDDEMTTAAQPAPAADWPAQNTQQLQNTPSVKQSIKQLVNDILPIPLPNLPAQKPLKSSLQELIRSAANKDRKAENQKDAQFAQNSTVTQLDAPEEQSSDPHPQTADNGQTTNYPYPVSDQNLTGTADDQSDNADTRSSAGDSSSAAPDSSDEALIGQDREDPAESPDESSSSEPVQDENSSLPNSPAVAEPAVQNQIFHTDDESRHLRRLRIKDRKHAKRYKRHDHRKHDRICEADPD